MPSQFLRLNCYGEQARARRKRHENAYDIIAEAARFPGSAPHVPKPQPPVLLYGIELQALRNKMERFARTARDRRGAPLRRDGAMLYAIVASYPFCWDELGGEEALSTYRIWCQAVIEWLKSEFGDALQCVAAHVDEARPHLHAFVIPPVCPRNRIDHHLHPGYAARDRVTGNGGDRLQGERAYRSGMRAWQDSFHKVVSDRFGHDRVGPRRKRFRRDAALMRQASDRLLKSAETITAGLLRRLDASPSLATHEERMEITTLAELFQTARRQLLDGRSDALITLGTALDDPESTDLTSPAKGEGAQVSEPEIADDWVNWGVDDNLDFENSDRDNDVPDPDVDDDHDHDADYADYDAEDGDEAETLDEFREVD